MADLNFTVLQIGCGPQGREGEFDEVPLGARWELQNTYVNSYQETYDAEGNRTWTKY